MKYPHSIDYKRDNEEYLIYLTQEEKVHVAPGIKPRQNTENKGDVKYQQHRKSPAVKVMRRVNKVKRRVANFDVPGRNQCSSGYPSYIEASSFMWFQVIREASQVVSPVDNVETAPKE